MTDSPTPAPADINLPHAYTVLGRIFRWMDQELSPPVEQTSVPRLLRDLDRLLGQYPYDPPTTEARQAAEQAAALARQLVEEIAKAGYQGDRLGQCVRNLFECLGLAGEGAGLSLLCGERPDSPLRP